MKIETSPPGKTQTLVKAQGFQELYGQLMLVDEKGFGRIFFEVTADPDQARYRPDAAFEQLLQGMQPGSTLRMMKIFWPNEKQRRDFLRQISTWHSILDESHPSLKRGLEDFLTSAPLPFFGQTLLECVVFSEEILAWIQSIPEILQAYGIEARKLKPDEIQRLTRHLLNSQLK